MSLADQFKQTHPQAFFLDADDAAALQQYLHNKGWLSEQRSIRALGKAGEGNMNLVLRATLDDDSTLIVKQSRPWVEKFPDYAAPAERANTEATYLKQISADARLAAHSPAVLHLDEDSHLLVMEDLGDGADLSRLYAGDETIDSDALTALLGYLSALHGGFTRAQCNFTINNRGMRALNAEHIFRFPFAADNGLNLDDITPGLSALAAECRVDTDLMAAIGVLERRYLAIEGEHPTLLHGDFFPGSFLQTRDGIKVIDAEFCFFGDAEFDVGVLLGHLMLAQQPNAVTDRVLADYQAAPTFSAALCKQFAGVEILRRLLGLAQLPVQLSIGQKTTLVSAARALILG